MQLTIGSPLVLLFAILIPRYMDEVLNVDPSNAAFIFAPTGVGALVGLRFIPWFSRWGKNRVVVLGLVGGAISLALRPPPGGGRPLLTPGSPAGRGGRSRLRRRHGRPPRHRRLPPAVRLCQRPRGWPDGRRRHAGAPAGRRFQFG